MKFSMITANHYLNDNGYIGMSVEDLKEMPDSITAEGETLLRKSEFHVSLMALKYLVPLLNENGRSVTQEQLAQDFIEFQSSTDVSKFHAKKSFRLVGRDERKTVVMMVDVPNIEALFDYFREKYRVDVPTQPTHITLYTLQPDRGISIFSNEELRHDSRPIDAPELSS